MRIQLNKFGSTLVSREAGKEAFAAFQSSLADIAPSEPLEVDFDGVITFSPSWGDEFISVLQDRYGDRLSLVNTDNPSVRASLETLETMRDRKFIYRAD